MIDDSANEDLVLNFHPLTKKLFYVSIFICVLFLLILYRYNLNEINALNKIEGIFRFFVLASLPIGILFRLLFYVRPKLFSIYKLSGNSLFIGNKRKPIEVHFSQIEYIKPSLLPARLLGGFVIAMKDGRRIGISSLIRDSQLILERCLRYDKELVNEKSGKLLALELKRTNIYWRQVYKKFFDIRYLGLKFVLLPSFASIFIFSFCSKRDESESFLSESIVNSFLLVFLFLLINSFIVGYSMESLHLKRMAKLKSNIPEDLSNQMLLIGEFFCFLLLGIEIYLSLYFTSSL